MDLPRAQFKVDITQAIVPRPEMVLVMVEINASRGGRTLHNYATHCLLVRDGLVVEWWMVEALPAESAEQQTDGGWMFDWLAWSPAQTTDWRGNVTLRALIWLRDNGRL